MGSCKNKKITEIGFCKKKKEKSVMGFCKKKKQNNNLKLGFARKRKKTKWGFTECDIKMVCICLGCFLYDLYAVELWSCNGVLQNMTEMETDDDGEAILLEKTLIDVIFSWSFKDVLNEDLYKDKVCSNAIFVSSYFVCVWFL